MIIVALLAVVIPLLLLGVFNLSARIGMSISASVVVFTGLVFWSMPLDVLLASIVQGVHKNTSYIMDTFWCIDVT